MLDLHIQDFLESLLSPGEFLKFKERPFHDRVERIKQRLEEALPNKAEFGQFFHRLGPLREIRNQIAHGILHLAQTSGQTTFVQTLSFPRDLDGSEAGARIWSSQSCWPS